MGMAAIFNGAELFDQITAKYGSHYFTGYRKKNAI